MITLKAAGGVVVRNNLESGREIQEALIIRRNGLWDLPKGKLETGESIEECAIREVEEETGVFPIQISGTLCTTVHTYRENGKLVEKTTYWFLMKAKDEIRNPKGSPQIDEGITEVAWESLEAALEKVHYENLKEVMHNVIETISS